MQIDYEALAPEEKARIEEKLKILERALNPPGKKMIARCFSDLPEEEKEKVRQDYYSRNGVLLSYEELTKIYGDCIFPKEVDI